MTIKTLLSLTFCLFLSVGVNTSVFAEETLKITIESISFSNDVGEELEGEEFRQFLTLAAGDVLDFEKLMTDIEHLKESLKHKYPNIEMNIIPLSKDTVRIHYELQKNRLINRVAIMAPGHNPKDLREQLQVIKGVFLKSSSIRSDEETIKTYFSNKGYPFVSVKALVTPAKGANEVDVTYEVSLNSEELKVNKIHFMGVTAFKTKELLRIMDTKNKGIFGSSIASREKLEKDMEAVQEHYKEHGFLNAQISHEFKRDEKKKNLVNVHVQVNESNQYIVKDVSVEGNYFFTTEIILNALDLKLPVPFNVKKQQSALQRVRDLYGEQGFALSQIQMNYDEETQTIKLTIIEGEIQKILKTEVVGNSRTDKKVVLENLTFSNGETMNSRKIRNSMEALYRTGLFKDVKLEYVPVTATAGKVVVQVTENSTRVIQFSVGAVNGSAGVGASISERNLFGTGSSLSMSGMISKEINRLKLIYNDPHLFGSEYELTSVFNHDRLDSHHYDLKKTSIKVMLEKQVTKNISLGIGTRLEFASAENIAQDYLGKIDVSQNKEVITGLISSFGYTIENTDKDGVVKNGAKISMVMLPSFNDEEFFFKAISNLTAFHNISTNRHGNSHQISGRITLGYATESSPFYEKFRGGGFGTIRGFEYESITGDDGKLGASTSVALNATYSFPLYKDTLSGVIFMDAFMLGDSSFNMGDIRLVGGIGMKAHIKAGFINDSVEAGVALPLVKKDGDITKPFYFIFGDYDPAYAL